MMDLSNFDKYIPKNAFIMNYVVVSGSDSDTAGVLQVTNQLFVETSNTSKRRLSDDSVELLDLSDNSESRERTVSDCSSMSFASSAFSIESEGDDDSLVRYLQVEEAPENPVRPYSGPRVCDSYKPARDGTHHRIILRVNPLTRVNNEEADCSLTVRLTVRCRHCQNDRRCEHVLFWQWDKTSWRHKMVATFQQVRPGSLVEYLFRFHGDRHKRRHYDLQFTLSDDNDPDSIIDCQNINVETAVMKIKNSATKNKPNGVKNENKESYNRGNESENQIVGLRSSSINYCNNNLNNDVGHPMTLISLTENCTNSKYLLMSDELRLLAEGGEETSHGFFKAVKLYTASNQDNYDIQTLLKIKESEWNFYLNNFERCEELAEEALKLADRAENRNMFQAWAFSILSGACRSTKRLELCQEYARKAVQVLEHYKKDKEWIRALYNLAKGYMEYYGTLSYPNKSLKLSAIESFQNAMDCSCDDIMRFRCLLAVAQLELDCTGSGLRSTTVNPNVNEDCIRVAGAAMEKLKQCDCQPTKRNECLVKLVEAQLAFRSNDFCGALEKMELAKQFSHKCGFVSLEKVCSESMNSLRQLESEEFRDGLRVERLIVTYTDSETSSALSNVEE